MSKFSDWDDRNTLFQFSARQGFLSLLQIVSTRNAALPAYRSIEHGGLSSGVKRIMHYSNHLPQFSLKVENKWSHTYIIHTPSKRAKRDGFNPLNPELNFICYLLALLGAHHFLHVNRIRVKLLTFRLLMSYIYGAPILDVSRSHTTTQHSR